ncbi:MAG: glucose-6-phosphate dehydrogenase assembly protein OpcA, partial [Actinomycetota bacterium]|nr:glucose-6-phosphate dehydrogenase assembly protein OpcA [Actinomycetota bacterium]
MLIDLTGTNAAKINSALVSARRSAGSPAMGMVLTLVIVTDEAAHYDALKAATQAAREHPSRILVAVGRPGRGEPRLDAEVRIGGENGPGEVILLRMHGALAAHADSVVLPLLLPDAPVVTWWPSVSPDQPAKDPLGALAQRRVTDTATAEDAVAALGVRAASYTPGDTDLSWTRLTPWRTLLAATLDEPYGEVTGVEITAEPGSASAELLALWLGDRLGVPVERGSSEGPGITSVRLRTADGDIAVHRPDGRLAMLSRPGSPDRPVALHRRSTAELIAEELRRLDPDDVYGDTIRLADPARWHDPTGAGAGGAASTVGGAAGGKDPESADAPLGTARVTAADVPTGSDARTASEDAARLAERPDGGAGAGDGGGTGGSDGTGGEAGA